MAAFLARCGNHDLIDIQHLLLTYPNEIQAFADRLDPEAVSVFLQNVSAANRARWSAVLGG